MKKKEKKDGECHFFFHFSFFFLQACHMNECIVRTGLRKRKERKRSVTAQFLIFSLIFMDRPDLWSPLIACHMKWVENIKRKCAGPGNSGRIHGWLTRNKFLLSYYLCDILVNQDGCYAVNNLPIIFSGTAPIKFLFFLSFYLWCWGGCTENILWKVNRASAHKDWPIISSFTFFFIYCDILASLYLCAHSAVRQLPVTQIGWEVSSLSFHLL